MGMFPKDIMSGGSGAMYNADDVWFVTRAQEKEEKEIVGYHFTIKIEKSRLVREGSKFPIYVSFKEGIDRWSGLLDFALEGSYTRRDGRGFMFPTLGDAKYQKDKLPDVWPTLLKGEFASYLNKRFALTPEEAAAKTQVEEE
jgi:hypothetical protein